MSTIMPIFLKQLPLPTHPWIDLVHWNKKKIYPKCLLQLPKKVTPTWTNRFFKRGKPFLYLPEKNFQFVILLWKKCFIFAPKKQIFQIKRNVYNYQKKYFPKQKSWCVLNTALLAFRLAKLNRVFKKLITLLVCTEVYVTIKNIYIRLC